MAYECLQGMDGDAHFGDTGALFGFAEGALDTERRIGEGAVGLWV